MTNCATCHSLASSPDCLCQRYWVSVQKIQCLNTICALDTEPRFELHSHVVQIDMDKLEGQFDHTDAEEGDEAS